MSSRFTPSMPAVSKIPVQLVVSYVRSTPPYETFDSDEDAKNKSKDNYLSYHFPIF